MIKTLEGSIRMYEDMKKHTESDNMRIYYDGKIDGLKDALKVIRAAKK